VTSPHKLPNGWWNLPRDASEEFDIRQGACHPDNNDGRIMTHLFFPPLDQPKPSPAFYNDARRICSSCDVETECLRWATAQRIPYGMFGGRSFRERQALRAVWATTRVAPTPRKLRSVQP
jgi:hypothetical protein